MEENKQQAYDEILVRLHSDPEIAYGSPGSAFRAVAEICSQAADVDRFTLWRPTAIETEYQCLEAYDRSQNTHTSGDILLINQYPAFFSALRNDRFTSIRQVGSDPRAAGLAEEYWKRQRIESALCVPLWIRGRLDGMISLERRQPGRDWERPVETFACQVADLVSSIILAGESTALKQQTDLYETTLDDLTRGTDPDIAVRRLLRYGVELLGCDSGLLFLNDAHRRQCCCTAAYNAPASYDQAVLAYGEDAAGTAAETGQALVLNNYPGWARRSPRFAADGFAEVMAAPLHMGAKVTGVLQVMRKDGARPFDEEDRRMLERVARQAAVAVDRSRQRDRRARDEAQSGAVGRMIGIAAQASDLTDMVDASLDLILESTALSQGAVHLDPIIAARGLTPEDEQRVSQALDREGQGFTAAVAVEDWETYRGALADLAPMMKGRGIQASLFVPILLGSSYLGCICLHAPSPRGWAGPGMAPVEAAARLIALSADKLSSHHYLDAHSRLVDRLNRINRVLNQLFSFDEAVRLTGQGTTSLLETDRAAIFLRNPDGSASLAWSTGLGETALKRAVQADNPGLVKMIFGFSTPTAVRLIKDAGFPAPFKKLLGAERIQSSILLPLIFSGQGVGSAVGFFRGERELDPVERSVMEAFTSQAAVAMQNAWMHEQMEQGYTDIALALARAMDARDSSISDASIQIAEWAEETGRRLGLSDQEIKDLHWAALLHNIGKVTVPEKVLEKPGKLDEAEWRLVQQYPARGEELIQPLARFHNVGQIIRHARERFDGDGYPDRCKGDEIPMAARILSVADAFTSMLDDRPYRKARNPQEAMVELERESGKQFDPQVVSVFVETVKKEKRAGARQASHPN